MTTVVKRILAGTIAAALLSACGGGSAPQSALPASSSPGKSTATISIKIPGSSVNVRGKRVRLYTSRDAKGVGIDIRSGSMGTYSNSANTAPAFGAALAVGSGACGAAGTDGSYSCSFTVPASVGYDTVRLALWNAAPANCSSSGANCSFSGDASLGVGVSTATIYAGSNNTIGGFTLQPIVDSIAVETNGGIQDGSSNSFNAFIVLKDAEGNTIVGSDQLIDAAGNNVTVYPAILNNNAGCNNNAHAVPLASGSCSLYFDALAGSGFTTAGAASSVTLSYDGTNSFPTSGASVPQMYANLYTSGGFDPLPGGVQKATIGVTDTTTGGVTSGQAPQYGLDAALALTPAEFSPMGGFIVSGYDGYIYALEGGPNTAAMQRFNPATPATLQTVSLKSNWIGGIANGTDNALWYIDPNAQTVYQQPYGTSDAGAISMTDDTVGDIVANLAAGPDGNMWFIRNLNSGGNAAGVLESVSPSMAHSTTTSVTGDLVNDPKFSRGALAAGTFSNGDQAVCTADTMGYVDCWDITAGAWKRFNDGGVITGMVFGGDGNLYYSLGSGATHISEATMSGGTLTYVTQYPLAAGETANNMTLGYDGNVWATTTGGANRLARISVENQTGCAGGICPGVLTEWSAAMQIPGNPYLTQIVAGPDHQLWATDAVNNSVDQIKP